MTAESGAAGPGAGIDARPAAGPVQPGERIATWDVLRGFAVLGILLANIPYMSMAGALTDMSGHYVGGDGWLDVFSLYLVYVVADTKFVTIFSFLFGVGLAWIAQRREHRGQPFKALYTRRLGVLLAFGALHGTLVWFGDILTTYAFIGFVAMWFRNCRVRTLVILAAILLLLNAVLWLLFASVDPTEFVEPREGPDGTELSAEATIALETDEYREVFASGRFGDMAAARSKLYLESQPLLLGFFGLRTLALFLLGIAAVRSGIFVDVAARRAMFGRLAVLGLLVGAALEGISVAAHAGGGGNGDGVSIGDGGGAAPRATALLFLYFGGLALASGYAAFVALWSSAAAPVLRGLRDRLAAVGRMALTSYLSHSVITAIVFNYCGQFDRWRRPELLLLVFGIFAFQLWISPIWLRHFRFGPLEWLWRAATYGRRVGLR